MDSTKTQRAHSVWRYLLLLLWLCPTVAWAQNDYEISGKVTEAATGEAVAAASVRLLHYNNGKEGALAKGLTTDKNGLFTIKGLAKGSYKVVISFVGFVNHEQAITLDKNHQVRLGTIKMSDNATLLKGVEVTGVAQPLRIKKDTVEFNAGAFKVREGAVIEELLKKLPGVEVDADGNITYNGEKIEKIEVDGKNFFSSDPKMATRNLPSLMVDKVQVVDKQTDESQLTGMDDGTRTKVLNLRLKQDMKKGLVSNAAAGYGTSKRYAGNAMINYFDKNSRYSLVGSLNNTEGILRGQGDRDTRRLGLNYETSIAGKLDLTAEIGYDGHDNNTTGHTVRQNMVGEKASNTNDEHYSTISSNNGVRTGARLEWTPDKKSTIYFTPELSISRSNSRNTESFTTTNAEGQEINRGTGLRTDKAQDMRTGAELHMRRTLSDAGRHIYLGLEGSLSKNEGDGTNLSTTTFAQDARKEVIDQMLQNNSNSSSLHLRSSYVEPISTHWAVQLNYRLNLQHRSSEREAYTQDPQSGAYTILDQDYSRASYSNTRNHAIGINARYKWGTSQVLLGFDARPSYAHTRSLQGTTETFNKERVIWNYAPSLQVEYRKSDSLFFNLRYNGRTEHPSMEQLNPASIINSPLSVTKGNPDLLPSFSHNLRFGGNFNRPSARQTLGVMGWISYTNNAVVDKRVIKPETGATETTFANVSGLFNGNVGFMTSTPLGGSKSPFIFFIFGRMSYNISKSYVNGELNTSHIMTPMLGPRLSWTGENLSIVLGARGMMQQVHNSLTKQLDRTSYDYTINNEINWKLPFNFEVTSNLSYTDKRGYTQGWDANILLWDMTLAKSFFRGNAATIELSVYDILGQRNTFSRSITASSITDRTVNGVTTYGMLTLKFKFNSFGSGNTPQMRSQQYRGFGPPPGHPGGNFPRRR